MIDGRKSLEFSGNPATRKRSSMNRVVRLTFWKADRSFSALDNEADRGNG